MQARLLVTLPATSQANPSNVVLEDGKRFILAGTVIEHPDAAQLVYRGFAESVDEECKLAVAKFPQESLGIARQVHDRIMREQLEEQQLLEEDEDDYDDEEGDE